MDSNNSSLYDGEHEGSQKSLRDKRADSLMRHVSVERPFEQATEEQEKTTEAHELSKTSKDIPAPSTQDPKKTEELPFGWSQCRTSKKGRPFFLYHPTRTVTDVDPRRQDGRQGDTPTDPAWLSTLAHVLNPGRAFHTGVYTEVAPSLATFWLIKPTQGINVDAKRRKAEHNPTNTSVPSTPESLQAAVSGHIPSVKFNLPRTSLLPPRVLRSPWRNLPRHNPDSHSLARIETDCILPDSFIVDANRLLDHLPGVPMNERFAIAATWYADMVNVMPGKKVGLSLTPDGIFEIMISRRVWEWEGVDGSLEEESGWWVGG